MAVTDSDTVTDTVACATDAEASQALSASILRQKYGWGGAFESYTTQWGRVKFLGGVKFWGEHYVGLGLLQFTLFITFLSFPSFPLGVIVHPSWVSQAPRVLSYCADALLFGP